MLSAGASVLSEGAEEGFGGSGIVGSLFGLVKDVSGFSTEPVVDRVLAESKMVFAQDAWNSLTEMKRQAVVLAIKELGI